LRRQQWRVAATVCCPTCWTWSEYKNSTACKRCGTPLILPDGRRVDDVTSGQPTSTPGAGYAFNAPMATLAAPSSGGMDWVAAVRWVTAAYGAVAIIGVLGYGLLFQYLNVPVQDPVTGRIIEETINIRPFLLGVAVVAAIIFGLFTWLVGYTLARVIWLALIVISAFATLSRINGEPSQAVLATVLSLAFSVSMAFLLVMSLLPPPERAVAHP
jgi:hypothetical protein